ncbi:CLUMA_CG002462, isoform A [Clunio marinus]|uniref:CLUMA_CG002462, isoform A n=1 Tax=Clunio marinus TaxID=568069 RepID=A0A1J1HQF3_9DIPT|nr:CLUMA_CG002462, isoform A [Clunio marinus]
MLDFKHSAGFHFSHCSVLFHNCVLDQGQSEGPWTVGRSMDSRKVHGQSEGPWTVGNSTPAGVT